MKNPPPISRIVLLACCAAFGLALAAFAYTGTFTRYWADDYCYNAVLNQDGFWKAQASFYTGTSNRYSVIPLVGISELFGPGAIRAWPLAAIVLGVAAGAWALRQGFRRVSVLSGVEAPWLLAIAGAEVVLFFTLWQAPNRFQALYWRTGMLTYFMPLLFQVVLAGWVLRHGAGPGVRAWATAGAALLAFLAGGFSETTAALQLGALALGMVGAWLADRAGFRRSAAARLLATALGGTLCAMVLLYVSPSNALRLVHFEKQAGPVQVVLLSLRFALDFLLDTFSSQPLPTGITILAGVGLGLYLSDHVRAARTRTRNGDAGQGGPRRWVGWMVGIVGVLYLLLACVMAPSVFVQVSYPEPRALIAARLVMVTGLVALGAAAGLWAAKERPGGLARAAAILLLVLAGLYAARSAVIVLNEVPTHSRRAAAWDERDERIRQKVQAGEQDITVEALDSVYGLMELLPEPDRWPNTCVAGAYGVRSITGEIP